MLEAVHANSRTMLEESLADFGFASQAGYFSQAIHE